MSRKAALIALIGAMALFGVLFYRVIRPFIFPMVFAAVLAVLFRPMHEWFARRLGGRRRIAAAVTTIAIVAVFVLPLILMLTLAGAQLVDSGREWVATFERLDRGEQGTVVFPLADHPRVIEAIEFVQSRFSPEDLQELRKSTSSAIMKLSVMLYERTQSVLTNVVVTIIMLVVLIMSLYYMFADGDEWLAEARRLSPLPDDEEAQLIDQFSKVCRGVVLGTVAAAMAQSVLAAIGFALVGVGKVWLLSVLTMFVAFIPFLGAAVVWLAVDLGLLLEQRYVAAAFLAVYGAVVISGSDNLIKAYILHGSAQLHPLLALISVLGGLQLFGLLGMFIGPITTAFFYALVKILHKRLVDDGEPPRPAPASGPATASLPQPPQTPAGARPEPQPEPQPEVDPKPPPAVSG